MDEQFLRSLVKDSRKGKEQERPYELKVYIVLKTNNGALNETLTSCGDYKISAIEQIADNRFKVMINNTTFYCEVSERFLIFYTAESSTTAQILEKYLEINKQLKRPWLEGYDFRKYIHDFVSEIGIIKGYSAKFEPFKMFTGYGITMRLWGERSDEILGEIRKDWNITPIGIKAEIYSDKVLTLNFRITNNGKISFIKGREDLFISFISYYISTIQQIEKKYEYKPITLSYEDDIPQLKFNEKYVLQMLTPDNKPMNSKEIQKAVMEMLTKGGKKYGFIGYSVGDNKANVIDLNENKMLYVTVFEDRISIMAKNPTLADNSLKHLHQKITEHIHPYIATKIEKMQVV
jgi:hypothetical protein